MEILTFDRLTFRYPDAPSPALREVSLSLSEGEFFLLCGASGCGKSTLLRHCKPQLAPAGEKLGEVRFFGTPVEALDGRTAASQIGFVMQSPENQIVTDKVWHELAFGLESLGMEPSAVRRRVAETASFFGIEHWFYKNTAELSGGQKQLLNLASAMALHPKILILDEPTASLDPIAAATFLETLQKINRELGMTVLLTDHRLEEAMPMANRVAVMEKGRMLAVGTPARVGAALLAMENEMFFAMPAAMQLWGALRTGADRGETDVPREQAASAPFAGNTEGILSCPVKNANDPGERKPGAPREGIADSIQPCPAKNANDPGERKPGALGEEIAESISQCPVKNANDPSERKPGAPKEESAEAIHPCPVKKTNDPGERRPGAPKEESVEAIPSCPVKDLAEGRAFLRGYLEGRKARPLPPRPLPQRTGEPAVKAEDVWFRYEKDSPDVLKAFSLTAYAGELVCILGGNGTGKTTALGVLAGLRRPYRGERKAAGRVALLPQDPQTLFLKKTVREDLGEVLRGTKLTASQKEERIARVLSLCRLTALAERHPYDLSGGEQQRAALGKLLLTEPEILLLDEPTKGMDAHFKREFLEILQNLKGKGVCILLVSHDLEFCAESADRCLLVFDGAVVCEAPPRDFFSGNRFYTTGAAHLAEGLLPGAVTVEELILAAGGRPLSFAERESVSARTGHTADAEGAKRVEKTGAAPESPAGGAKKRFSPRQILAFLSASASLLLLLFAARTGPLSEMIGKEGITAAGWRQMGLSCLFLLFLLLTALLLARRAPADGGEPSDGPPRHGLPGERRLSTRTKLSVALLLSALPLTLFLGLRFLGREHYLLTALAMLAEGMLPFFLVFEGKKPRARELVLLASLCGLAVAGRAAFFMLPECKPVLAVTILCGVALGGEDGFLVGAVSMLLSNLLFSQGPWTPWQMFAMGMIGFLAGILYRGGLLRRTRASLCAFGAVSALCIYGGIMNFASALIWSPESLNGKILLSYFLAGFPMDCIHALSTVLFLWFLTRPFLEKLDRVKTKYGL